MIQSQHRNIYQLTALHWLLRFDWYFKELSSLLSRLFHFLVNFPINGIEIFCQKQQSAYALLSVSTGWSAVAVHILAEVTFWKCVWFCVLCLHVCVETPVLVHRFRFVFAYSHVDKSGFVCLHWKFHAHLF